MPRPRVRLLTVLFLLVPLTARAQAPDERSELERRVDAARVDFQFLSTPIGKVVEYLARRTELPIRLSTRAPDDAVVTLSGSDAPLRRALRWASFQAGLDYHVDGGEVFVGTKDEIAARRVVLRTFDVRDLTLVAQDSPGPDLSIRAVESLPADSGEPTLTLDLLATLIEESFEPGTWDAPNSISARQGVLFVRHDPRVVERIARFLAELRRHAAAMVTVEARLLSMTAAEWERSFRREGGADARIVLDAAAWDEVRARLDAAEDVVRLADLRTIGAPGQRVHALAGDWKSYLGDFDVQVAQGAGTADSIVKVLYDGAMIDVRPVPSGDARTISVDLIVRAADGDVSRSVPFGPDDRRREGAEVPAIELPAVDELALETRVRVPDRGAFVATFVNPMGGGRDRRIVLVVEPRLEEEGR